MKVNDQIIEALKDAEFSSTNVTDELIEFIEKLDIQTGCNYNQLKIIAHQMYSQGFSDSMSEECGQEVLHMGR